MYEGEIRSYNGDHYSVQYKDGDTELLTKADFDGSDIEVVPETIEID